MERFLKRDIYDPNTRTYRFSDSSGVVPEEMRNAMQIAASGPQKGAWLRAWTVRWNWQERLDAIKHGLLTLTK